MAALDFPDTPAIGDLHGSSGTLWRWDGARWASTSGSSGARGVVAYTQVTTNQAGTFAAETDLAGLTATWVASPARTYRTTVYVIPSSSVANDDVSVSIRDGAGTRKQLAGTPYLDPATSTSLILPLVETGLSGTQTRKVTAIRNGTGTVTFGASPTYPAFILVEDITFDAGPAAAGAPTAWTPYTPTITAATTNPNLGTGGLYPGFYARIGNTIHWRVYCQSQGTGISAGSGVYNVSLPVPGFAGQIVGYGWMYGTNGFKPFVLDIVAPSGTRPILQIGGAYLDHTNGFSGAGHVLAASGTYEAAA